MKDLDLFGKEIVKDTLLRNIFIEPPFTILDTKTSSWRNRSKKWKELGIKSELGRDASGLNMPMNSYSKENGSGYVSIFDPALCEVLYSWFCVGGNKILDPFAGGSVRGIVANKLGYEYTGIEIRKNQVISNREQGTNILKENKQPLWIVGDSNKILDTINDTFDFVFSCPPYSDLEVYSDIYGDISNMVYSDFLESYESIISKSCSLLKTGGFACFVVGEVRDKKGNYIGFVPDTINAFKKCGMSFYNEAILLTGMGSASMRANKSMKNQKLVKIHQNVLVFKKQ